MVALEKIIKRLAVSWLKETRKATEVPFGSWLLKCATRDHASFFLPESRKAQDKNIQCSLYSPPFVNTKCLLSIIVT
jgi:hypothetical protein